MELGRYSGFIELLLFRIISKLLSILSTGKTVKDKAVQIIFHLRSKHLSNLNLTAAGLKAVVVS